MSNDNSLRNLAVEGYVIGEPMTRQVERDNPIALRENVDVPVENVGGMSDAMEKHNCRARSRFNEPRAISIASNELYHHGRRSGIKALLG
jgi:hypothetical protein